jgi:PhnB protein
MAYVRSAKGDTRMNISLAESDADIAACYTVMRELRPHIAEDQFLARVRRQEADGYRLALARDADQPVAVAGFRVLENLAWGRFLYVDDLVTLSALRSHGFGAKLLAWLRQRAVQENCAELHLDSGIQRTDAHRFYEREGMTLSSFHFAEKFAFDDAPTAALDSAADEQGPGGKSKGIPEGASAIIPRLVCRDPGAEINFCVSAFEAVELVRRPGPDGAVAHALLTIRSEMLMIEAEWPTLTSRAPKPDGSSPVVIYVYVEDVDQTVERAVTSGAQVLIPAKNQFWGDRTAWIMDPAGHVWTIATRIEETSEKERQARWSNILTQQT